MRTVPDTQRKENAPPQVEIFSFTMKIGDWKKIFRPPFYKTLIAASLNCTVHKEFRNVIVGYLISDRRLCLVLRMEEKKVRKLLEHFYAHLRSEISNSLDAVAPADMEYFTKEIDNARMNSRKLFTEYPLKDEQLIRLLTGRKVDAPYTDPRVARLKDQIRNYPFCSAVDYAGGESPVLVKVLKSKEWIHQTGHHP
jgi:hypothetical protein